jgi:two-component system cell cycle sensor histidine kinase/response regulator CckA
LNLNDLVREMERMLRRVMGEEIELITNLGSEIQTVRADPGQVEQVVLNIALNARDAMPGGGKLTIETNNAEVTQESGREHPGLSLGSYVVLSLTDTGSGMDPSVRSRVFEPFFTTKEHGTGLGLSTSYGIIKQTGGDIWVESRPGSGTTFRIYLPVAQQISEEVAAPQSSTPFQGTETILLVEDEEGVRRVVETMLKRRGYKVLSSGSPAEALAIAESHQDEIHLLIADMVMPHMSGQKMAERLMVTRPHLRVLYVSGYGDQIDARTAFAFLQKPFSTEELALKVREVLRESVKSASS